MNSRVVAGEDFNHYILQGASQQHDTILPLWSHFWAGGTKWRHTPGMALKRRDSLYAAVRLLAKPPLAMPLTVPGIGRKDECSCSATFQRVGSRGVYMATWITQRSCDPLQIMQRSQKCWPFPWISPMFLRHLGGERGKKNWLGSSHPIELSILICSGAFPTILIPFPKRASQHQQCGTGLLLARPSLTFCFPNL